MYDKIFDIVTDLLRGDISKEQSIDMLMEINLIKYLEEMESRIMAQINAQDAPKRIIYDMNEVRKVTGYSNTTINKLISTGQLNPWQEFPGGKLSFYRAEVEGLIPKNLLASPGGGVK